MIETPPFLHRFCPDHNPGIALCGIDLGAVDEVAAEDLDAAAETMPWCVVCADLVESPCEDACIGAYREATA